MSTERIYDPANPNLNGYRRLRWEEETTVAKVIRAKFRRAWINLLWNAYGRHEIVAWYLHREQHFAGRIVNRVALQILNHIYGP